MQSKTIFCRELRELYPGKESWPPRKESSMAPYYSKCLSLLEAEGRAHPEYNIQMVPNVEAGTVEFTYSTRNRFSMDIDKAIDRAKRICLKARVNEIARSLGLN